MRREWSRTKLSSKLRLSFSDGRSLQSGEMDVLFLISLIKVRYSESMASRMRSRAGSWVYVIHETAVSMSRLDISAWENKGDLGLLLMKWLFGWFPCQACNLWASRLRGSVPGLVKEAFPELACFDCCRWLKPLLSRLGLALPKIGELKLKMWEIISPNLYYQQNMVLSQRGH